MTFEERAFVFDFQVLHADSKRRLGLVIVESWDGWETRIRDERSIEFQPLLGIGDSFQWHYWWKVPLSDRHQLLNQGWWKCQMKSTSRA
jgi:hypothetical protein